MACPHCNNDLKDKEILDNIFTWTKCPKCFNEVWLDYNVVWNELKTKTIEIFQWVKTRNVNI